VLVAAMFARLQCPIILLKGSGLGNGVWLLGGQHRRL